jgi:hypothetical protein
LAPPVRPLPMRLAHCPVAALLLVAVAVALA